jgi:molybdopterin synthase sulfur carrier subunit
MKILFFGQLKERINTSELQLTDDQCTDLTNVKALREYLQNHYDWHEHFDIGQTLVAVNQQIVDDKHLLITGDEVAFFPPVTGG